MLRKHVLDLAAEGRVKLQASREGHGVPVVRYVQLCLHGMVYWCGQLAGLLVSQDAVDDGLSPSIVPVLGMNSIANRVSN